MATIFSTKIGLCHSNAHAYVLGQPSGYLDFHEWTKNFEINFHFICDMVLKGVISTPHVSSLDHIMDIGVAHDSLVILICKLQLEGGNQIIAHLRVFSSPQYAKAFDIYT